MIIPNAKPVKVVDITTAVEAVADKVKEEIFPAQAPKGAFIEVTVPSVKNSPAATPQKAELAMGFSAFISSVEKDVEIGVADVLKVFGKAQTEVQKVVKAEPAVLAALGAVAAAVTTAVTDAGSAVGASGLNFTIDAKLVPDIQAVWPDVKEFLATLGITIK